MKFEEIDKFCDLFEQGLKSNLSISVDEFIREHNLPDDERLVAELQRVAAEYSPAGLATTGLESTGVLAGAAPCAGEMIGPYKLLQQIGEGGMGTVYMAQQEKPVQRRVALKVIKPGMGSKEVIARFEAERQALAMMNHENIAKIFDAGTTTDGRPYFVMELVRGAPLTQFCDENKLTIPERLKLFVLVCQAVQHAHQKGIIHRDIKPSNVLVSNYDGRPVPKVIDFGVAKAIQQKLTEKTLFTEFGRVIGTLQYMSPEQAGLSQLDVDTRSDIYALGVLLYELLTGTTPIEKERIRQAGWEKIMQVIREEEPQKPSTKVSESGDALSEISQRRGTSPRSISSLIRGDLDWIVMKALEKDRSRRYETTNQLADDLENYLHDRPVLARAPSTWYRLAKAIKRNRAAVTSLSAVFLMLLTISFVLLWKNTQLAAALNSVVRAEGEATAINDFFINDLLGKADPDMNPYQEKATVVTLVDRTANKIEDSSYFQDQAEVEATIRLVIGKTYYALGRWQNAKKHLVRSLAIRREQLGNQDPKTLEALGSLVDVQIELEEATPALEAALELEENWRRYKSDSDRELVEARIKRSNSLLLLGRYSEAESVAKDVLKSCEGLNPDDERTIHARQAVAENLAAQFKEFDFVQSLFEQNLASHAANNEPEYSDKTLTTKLRLAEQLISQGRAQDAENLYAEVLNTRSTQTLPDDHPNTISARLGLGWAQMHLGKFELSTENFRNAYQQSLKILGEDHRITWLARHAIVMACSNNVLVAPNRPALIDEAIRLAERNVLSSKNNNWPREHSNWHQSQVDLAMALAMQGMLKKSTTVLGSVITPRELGKAETILQQLYRQSKELRGPTHSSTVESGMHVAQVRCLKGEESAEVEQLLRDLLGETNAIPVGIPLRPTISQTLGSLLDNTNRSGEAEPLLREHYLYCRRFQNFSQIERINSTQNLLQCLRHLDREQELLNAKFEKNEVYRVRVKRASAMPVVCVRSGNSNIDGLYNHDQNSSHVFVNPSRSKTITVLATALASDPQPGNFEVEIERCELSKEQNFQGELQLASELDALANNLPREIFPISMSAGRLYRIEAKSSTFRPHIRIEDSHGQCLKWIQQNPQNLARLEFSPDTDGEFRVIVVATIENSFGKFSLSVNEYTPTGKRVE